MARISGVDLPREKRVEIGLTYIYGIGLSSAKRILAEANVDPDTRVRDLTDDEVKRISAVINDTQVVEGDLRREIALNIKRLKEIEVPVVIFDKTIPQDYFEQIIFDNKLNVETAVEKLANNECKNILAIFGDENLEMTQNRRDHFLEKLQKS